jgi:probable HAF family extracellular repeat protein
MPDSDFEVDDMARHGTKLVALASAVLVLAAGVPAGAAGTADRTLKLIRLDSGGVQGEVLDINARGQILGYLADAGPIRPILWRRNGAAVAIGVPGGYPHGLNDRGDVVLGASLLSTDPSLWSNGQMTPVAHPSRTVHVLDINNRRQVVGSLTTDSPQQTTAFRWRNGQFIELDGPAGKNTIATAVNERGDVLGLVLEPFGPTVDTFVWRKGAMSLLGLSGEQGNARDINDRGQVIGNRFVGESGSHPFLWQRGTMTDLMAGRPDLNASAADINNAGDVVGRMDSRPALWRHGRTVLIGPAAWTGSAQAINEHGDVAGAFTINRVEDEFDSLVFLWRDGRLLLSEPVIRPLRPRVVGMDESGRIAGYLSNSETGESRPVVWAVG